VSTTQQHEDGRISVDLFEYQAKQLFQQYGVPVSLGEVATTADEA
jgi:succinyl-CoA synthetase beta subunit